MSTPSPATLQQSSISPNRDIFAVDTDLPHWSQALYECEVFAKVDGTFDFIVEGGSDNGEFPFFGNTYHGGYENIEKGDILLEIQGQKIAGYTQRDVISWLVHCARNGNFVKIKAVKSGYLTKDLRHYLNGRFQKGSLDHDLQNTIRDNLYLRTVPCTTRIPRCAEINGVDYTFLSVEEFIALERSGNLLESGIYEGNLYGTPRPAPAASAFSASTSNLVQSSSWNPVKTGNTYGTAKSMKEDSNMHSPAKRNNSIGSNGIILPGAHASSEGKRRRNRSNVEAMASKTSDVSDYSVFSHPHPRSATPISDIMNKAGPSPQAFINNAHLGANEQENNGNFPRSYVANGQPYFVKNNSPPSHWLDPRLSRVQSSHPEHFCDNDLPFGWERIDDPHYGTYYIDHVNRRTQYENPVLHASIFNQSATSKDFASRSLSWNSSRCEQRSDQSQSLRSPCSDSKISSRNSSLTQTTNRDSLTPANTNSESPLVDGSTSLPIPTSNTISSSPAATHRFPYLHCIPCLSEKHDPKHHLPTEPSNPESSILPNDTISSDSTFKKSGENAHFNSLNNSSCQESSRPSSPTGVNTIPKQPSFFTLNPDDLRGVFIHIPLLKSSRGLGFTIIGGDSESTQEFLQIKDVVPYGPAWRDGKLQTGDILVYVNTLCVLGYSHKDVIALFQSIPAGNVVHLEVCRGYVLPFDPNDPNNEIVTTVAVSLADAKGTGSHNVYSTSQSSSSNSKLTNSAQANFVESMNRATKSMPDLNTTRSLTYNGNNKTKSSNQSASAKDSSMPDRFSVDIVKGAAGFGFTIADSSYGQKVKKILDRPRCKHLQEGVILVEINGRVVQNLPHTEVVQILKDCPRGEAAHIVVQRGHLSSLPSSSARPKIKDSTEENQMKPRTDMHENSLRRLRSHQPSATMNKEEKFFNGYRSKTPTAELYSSREKEPIIVPRPKTPLVDSRNWVKSSPSYNSSDPLRSNLYDLSSQDGRFPPFKDGAQLDRETTNYLMFEPSQEIQNGTSTWYSDRNHSRSWLNDDSFRDTDYNQDSETLTNVDDSQISTDTHNATSNFSLKKSQVLPSGAVHYENDFVGKDSFYTSSSFDTPDFSMSTWQNSFQSKGDNKQVTPNSSSNVPKNDGSTSFPKANHFPPLMSNHTSYQDQDISPNDPLIQTFHASNYNGDSLDSNHRRKHDDMEPLMNCDSHDQTFNSSKVDDSQTEASETYINMVVTLYCQINGFGFRILGGTEEGSQVSIGHIVAGGAADLDGRLQTGDEILGVDGLSVLHSSHHDVVELMNNASSNGKVTLHLKRSTATNSNGSSLRNMALPYEVVVNRNENEGFGFVLISSLSRKGSTIGRIIEGSPADRCGQLFIGDVIEAVNGISILNRHHGEIVSLIKECGNSITLRINRLQDNSSSITSSQKCDDSLLDPDDSYHSIELQRGTKGFGFSIRGGREFYNMPLFVLRIAENGPADQDGRIQVNDQIVEINGVCTRNMTHAEAIDLIREGGQTVRLLVKRNTYYGDSSRAPHQDYQNNFQTLNNQHHASNSAVEAVCQTFS